MNVDGNFHIRCPQCSDSHFSHFKEIQDMKTDNIDGKEVVRLDLGGCRCGFHLIAYINCSVVNANDFKERLEKVT
jgi:hypothetical protein